MTELQLGFKDRIRHRVRGYFNQRDLGMNADKSF